MTVYVAEIAGRNIAAFDAANDIEAESRLADQAFRRDLIVLQNQGHSLWSGVAPIHLRRASPEEAVTWQAGMTADGENRFVFLIPVVDPPDNRFDDDDHDHDDHDDHD